MKSKLSTIIVSVTLAISGLAYVGGAVADEGKMLTPVTKITLAADGKQATAVLKDTKTAEPVTLTFLSSLRGEPAAGSDQEPGNWLGSWQ